MKHIALVAAAVVAFLAGLTLARLLFDLPERTLSSVPLEVSAAQLWHGAPRPKLGTFSAGRLTTETVRPERELTAPATTETLARVADYCAPVVARRTPPRDGTATTVRGDSLSRYPLSRETLALAGRLRFGTPLATDTMRHGPPLPGPRPLPDVESSPLVRAPAMLPPFRGRVTRERLELWAIRGDGTPWYASYRVRHPSEFVADKDSMIVRGRRAWVPDFGAYTALDVVWPHPVTTASAGVQAEFADAVTVRAGAALSSDGTARLTAGVEREW